MTDPRFDIRPFLRRDEGQHFDRKSLLEGPAGAKRFRQRRPVRDQVAEYVAAFANAEGGVLILGIEDDCEITGHRLPPQALEVLLATPSARLAPPQAKGFVVEAGGVELVVFDVPVADGPVQVVGDGFPLRVGDRTVQASEAQIQAVKLAGLSESWESRPSPCSLGDLDSALIARAKEGAGLAAWSDEDYLLKRKLADGKGQGIVLRRAAELLFARFGPDHPNAGVRLFRVIGRDRLSGVHHNVEERPRIEANLPTVIAQASAQTLQFLRRPSRLFGTRFREVPEYPDFAWEEALVNAVAHRDYGVEGASNEIWLYEDRMEVISPGDLPGDLTLSLLLAFERKPRSRNPRIVRVLVDLGQMRDRGEGVPRMFAEMEDAFLPRPEIEVSALSVTVTLRNETTLTREDHRFVSGLGDLDLAGEEFRALLHAHRHETVDNAAIRQLTGLDTLGASALLGTLRDRELLTLHAGGPDSFYTLSSALSAHVGRRPIMTPDTSSGTFGTSRSLRRETQTASHDEPDSFQGLPEEVQAAADALGRKPGRERLRTVILAICTVRSWTTKAELARFLRFRPRKLTDRHLAPLVESGHLERRFPDRVTHPGQAYRITIQKPPLLPFGDGDLSSEDGATNEKS